MVLLDYLPKFAWAGWRWTKFLVDADRPPRIVLIGHEDCAKAHQHGIFHRDIKPGTVIVANDGIARIIDFGLAKSSDVTATAEVTSRGTPLYMSPDQASGRHQPAPGGRPTRSNHLFRLSPGPVVTERR
jgi:serine/threonine protein kinase